MTCSTYVQAFWRPHAASMLGRLSALAFWPLPLPSFWLRAFWKLCGRSSVFAFGFVDRFFVVELFFFGDGRLRLPCTPLPCCTNCGTRECTNHGPDDRHAQCCSSYGASRCTTKGATSRAYPCISGTLILIFVVHVSLPTLREMTLALVSLAVNKRLFVMHCRETLVDQLNHCSAFVQVDPPDLLPTPPLFCRALAGERRKKAHPRQ